MTNDKAGNVINFPYALTPQQRRQIGAGVRGDKKSKLTPAGYAAIPGTGPEGETCKTCRHIERIRLGNTYRKCGLMRQFWKGSAKTDIKARSPACSKWEPRPKGDAARVVSWLILGYAVFAVGAQAAFIVGRESVRQPEPVTIAEVARDGFKGTLP